MNNLKKKGILLVVSILLLIAAGVYFTLAWYTKMTSVGDLEFDVARWDYSANYSLSDYTVNVYTYSQLNNKKAAPGTAGVVPFLLSAEESDADIKIRLTIDKSTMSPEFQERIFFYSDPDMTEMLTADTPIIAIVKRGETLGVPVYWKWIYEFDDIPEGYATVEDETAESFDVFDTQVGKRPDLYEPQMNATATIMGLQAEPTVASN